MIDWENNRGGGFTLLIDGKAANCRCGAPLQYDKPFGEELHRCERGLGEWIYRILCCTGVAQMHGRIRRWLGLNRECGCAARRRKMNKWQL